MAKSKLPRLPKLAREKPERVIPLPPRKRNSHASDVFEIDERIDEDAAKLSEETGKDLDDLITPEEVAEMAAEQALTDRKMNYMSPEEKMVVLRLYSRGIKPSIIARKLGRNHSVIVRYLDKYRTSVPEARLLIEAGAERLASRVIKRANVTEGLEVLDRLDVLPKKARDKESSAPSVNVLVGVPGNRSAIPVPSQSQIEAATSKEDR